MNTLKITADNVKKLEEIRLISKDESLIELINKAISLYEFKIKEEQKGKILALIDQETKSYAIVNI